MDNPKLILDEISPCLSHWDIQPASIELASHSENIVYKVTADDGAQYALRVHRPGYHSLARLKSEQIWTDALIDYGLLVPRAYPTVAGDYCITAECGGIQRQVGLIGWLEGQQMTALFAEDPEAAIPLPMMREAGAICAQLRTAA